MYLSPDASPAIRRRQKVELRIVKATVKALIAAGYTLRVDDGEEVLPILATKDTKALYDALYNTDEDYLMVYRYGVDINGTPGDISEGYVRFVYGNDGWDVICDYTTNLEAVLAPVNALAEKLAN